MTISLIGIRKLTGLRAVLFVLAVLVGFGSGAVAQSSDGIEPSSSDDLLKAEQAAFQRAVATVAPSVVQIETFGGLERLDDRAVADGPITGTIIADNGWIISSLYGLRQQPASILVNLPGGQRVPARIVARDHARELVLLKVDTDLDLPVVAPSPSTQWQVGQWCVAIGRTYDPDSVTQSPGIISALGRAYGRAVQTDAKVSPINYGGPLIDLQGQVIGILAPVAAAEMLGDDGAVLYDSGIGFAIPLADIIQRLPQLQAGQDIHPGKLGIVTEDQNEMAGPVRITGAAPGSPAARAGVKAGDVIVAAQEQRIKLLADLRHAIAEVDAGGVLEFEVERTGEVISLEAELVSEIPVYRRRYMGIRVAQVEAGLKIESVMDRSPASRTGLKEGDVITECNEIATSSRSDLEQILATADLEVALNIRVTRADAEESISIQAKPSEWPRQPIKYQLAIQDKDSEDASEKDSDSVRLLELRLADMPNRIHAMMPSGLEGRRTGCLILYGQPGEILPEKIKQAWERLVSDFGWIVLFPESANPQTWARDEIELASRLLARMDQEYSIDRSRTVIGGWGVGGQLALLAALAERQRCSGVLVMGTKLQSFMLRQPNAPLQTLDFLMIGDRSLESSVERLDSLGYTAHWISLPDWEAGDWKALPIPAIESWLETLDYL